MNVSAQRPEPPPGSTPAPSRRSVAEGIGTFFAVDDPWQRPRPTAAQQRRDVWIAAGVLALTAVGMELTRSLGAFQTIESPLWMQYVAMVVGVVPLIWRRTRPLASMVIIQLHMLAATAWWPSVGNQFTMLIVYLASLVGGVGWARNRRALVGLLVALFVLVFGQLAWMYTFTTMMTEYLPKDGDQPGLLPPMVASVLYGSLMNLGYILGGILWGQLSWRAAKRMATVSAQAATITEQAVELRDRAVVDERLRIARELHDVVAHHVSVMGVQAAAARRVLSRDPEAAAQALGAVEESSRQAVGEMRSLLGALRGVEVVRAAQSTGTSQGALAATERGRSPEPGLAQLPELVAQAASTGFEPTYELVEQTPGAARQVSAAIGMSIYRIVQEALSNVRKHSTARRAVVVVRVDGTHAEAEVVDDGRPRGATSGSGLGLLGMRERIASHQGSVELGPRLVGGYRVRVRFPLEPALHAYGADLDPGSATLTTGGPDVRRTG